MASLSTPITASAANAQLGFNHILSAEIQLELAERLDVMSLGVVPLVGDLAGSGTTTIRVRHVGGLGWDARLQQMASETDAPVMASPTAGYTSCSLGQYGLGMSDTFLGRITADAAARMAQGTDAFRNHAVDTFLATFRKQVCVTGATISGSVGSAATSLSVDTLIAFSTAYNTTDGADVMGRPTVMLDPTPVEEAKASARSEPAFQGDMDGFKSVQGASGRFYEDFLGLGFNVAATSDVSQSGGAYQGFGFQPGGIGFAKASTSPLDLGDRLNAVYVDEYGLVVYDVPSGVNQQVLQTNILAYIGWCLGDSDVYFSRRILSTT